MTTTPLSKANAFRARRRLGAFGEQVAGDFLERQGIRIVDRNVRVGRAELDLIALDGGGRFVVEVKCGTGGDDDHPRWHFTEEKAQTVVRAARRLRLRRIDLVTVVVGRHGVDIEWFPRVA